MRGLIEARGWHRLPLHDAPRAFLCAASPPGAATAPAPVLLLAFAQAYVGFQLLDPAAAMAAARAVQAQANAAATAAGDGNGECSSMSYEPPSVPAAFGLVLAVMRDRGDCSAFGYSRLTQR